MNTKTKFLSIVLAVSMLLSTMVMILPASAEEITYWTDYAATSFAGGDGSAENPYQIATAEQLAYMSKLLNDTEEVKAAYRSLSYVLTADINLSGHDWVSMGEYSASNDYRFTGTFDGKGHTISGMTVSSADKITSVKGIGLFGCLGSYAVVANFKMTNVSINIPTATLGGVASGISAVACFTSGASQVRGVEVTGNILLQNAKNDKIYVGGIVANGNNGNVLNCTMNGSVTVNSTANAVQVGGIVGYNTGYTVISGNTNNATVSGSSVKGKNIYLAGICPYNTLKKYSGSKYMVLTDNVNNGTIQCDTACSTLFAGGIAAAYAGGYFHQTTGNTNNGDLVLRADGANIYAGGIIGSIYSWNPTYNNLFENNTNNGNITVTGTGGTNTGLGGVAGVTGSNGTVGSVVNIKNCVNTGNIDAGRGSDLFGGIVGYSRAAKKNGENVYTVNYTACINTGKIVGPDDNLKETGICGSTRSDSVFANCYTTTDYVTTAFNQNAGVYITVNGKTIEEFPTTDWPVCLAASVVPDTCFGGIKIETLERASVRMPSDGNAANSGIRFDSVVSKQIYEALLNAGATVSVGTLIAPTQNLNHAKIYNTYDKKAAFDSLNASNAYAIVPYDDAFVLSSDDKSVYYFSGAIRNMLPQNYALKFSAIAYMTVEIGDFAFTFWADYNKDDAERTRSISQIAGAAFEDRLPSLTSGKVYGKYYTNKATEENACYLGEYSPYNNNQLSMLRNYCNYQNTGSVADGITINGVALKDYTIVYAHSILEDNLGSDTGKSAGEDLAMYLIGPADIIGYDYDRQTAERLQAAIKDKFGIELPVRKDTAVTETAYEILVGKTNRQSTSGRTVEKLGVDEFMLKIDGTKFLVCGGAYGSTWHAVEAFEEAVKNAGADFEIKTAGDLSGSFKLQKIACIGDSITRGSQAIPDSTTGYLEEYMANTGLTSDVTVWGSAKTIYLEQFLSYPANLQREMWKDAVVYNYGRGASTACHYTGSTSPYYRETVQFANCMENAKQVDYDMVFIMIGSNDASRYSAGTRTTEWVDEIKYLMDTISAQSAGSKFILMNGPYRGVDGEGKYTMAAMREVQKQGIAQLKTEGYDIYSYDMATFTKNHLISDTITWADLYNQKDNEIFAAWVAEAETLTGDEKAIREDRILRSAYYNVLCGDGTHPSFYGYHTLAAEVLKIVKYVTGQGPEPEYTLDTSAVATSAVSD